MSARLIVEIDKTSSNSVGAISLSSLSFALRGGGEVISFRSKGEKLTAVDSSGHLGEGEFCGFSSVQSALN